MYLAYICSPYRAETEAELDNHIEYAQALTRLALKAGLAPVTPHLYLTQVTNEEETEERRAGLTAGQELLTKCDLMIIGNKYGVSEGMKEEIMLARSKQMTILAVWDRTTPRSLTRMIEEIMHDK